MYFGEVGFWPSMGSTNGLFFLIFHQPGDFIANRTYGDELHTASWSQGIQLGGLSLLRIKSTYGEPSFFSAGVIPYLFLALENKRKYLSVALLFCVIFSTSSSAFLAFAFALLLHSFFQRKLSGLILLTLLLFAAAFATLYFVYPETYDHMFTAKLNGENMSSTIRQDNAQAMRETAANLHLSEPSLWHRLWLLLRWRLLRGPRQHRIAGDSALFLRLLEARRNVTIRRGKSLL